MTVPHISPDDEQFGVSLDDDGALVTFRGDFDLVHGVVLDGILDALENLAVTEIRLDASEVTFVDCSFLNAVIEGRRRLARDGGWFHIVEPSGCVIRLLALAGEDRLLQTREGAKRPDILSRRSRHGSWSLSDPARARAKARRRARARLSRREVFPRS